MHLPLYWRHVFSSAATRKKDGKEHRSWSIVESRRVRRGVVQRHVLYLGEINDSQRARLAESPSKSSMNNRDRPPVRAFPRGIASRR